jgi:hypothetical protein
MYVYKRKNFQEHAMSAIRTYEERPSIFIRDNSIFSSQMLHKDYYHKDSVEKIYGHESQVASRKDELLVFGGKPPDVK